MKLIKLMFVLSALFFCNGTHADNRITIGSGDKGIFYRFDTLNHVMYVDGKGLDRGDEGWFYDDLYKDSCRKYFIDTKEIVFGKDVEGVGFEAYQGFPQLKAVTFLGNTQRIGSRAFAECTGLERVTLPISMQTIGDRAFEDCSALSDVKFPQALDSIEADAFARTALKEAHLPQNLRHIGKQALAGLVLSSVRLPDSLKVLPGGLFLFSKIGELYIPSTVNRIEPMAFAGVFQVKRVYLNWNRPEDVDVSISSFDFSGMDSMEFVVPDGTFDLYYGKLDDELNFPSSCRITEKSALARKGDFRWRLERKTLMVDKADFNYVSNLDCDYFDEKLKYDKVKKLVINEGITRLPYGFCRNLGVVEEIHLPASLREIACEGLLTYNRVRCSVSPANPFYVVQDGFLFDMRDSSIVLFPKGPKEMNIPAYVKSIRSSAFLGCCFDSVSVDEKNPYFSARKNVLFSKRFDTLYYYACGRKQKEYVIPETVTTIGDFAFSGQKSLENVRFGGGVRRIGNCAFLISGLRKVVLPPSVEYLGIEVFSYNTQLEYVDLSSTKIKTLNRGLFVNCSKMTDVLLPNGLESILEYSFGDTQRLKKIDLPSSLKIIRSPFDGSAITTLQIPDSVIWIYDPLSSKTKDVYLDWRGGSVYNDVYIMGNNDYNYTKESEYRYFDMVYLVPKLYVPEENDWKFWKEEYKMDIRTNGRLYLK
ncbi:MAG: leucine-rich repeat protein [Paludibacteraceae bacterium]|nr:leucine-rich repeat protein [Paludibacteraceae bacterium]